MTFLAPVAGLVALGLGLPALLAFYLLRLRRRPVRVSSTMFWEQATQDLQVNVPLRWLRPSWLLLLHVLILLLLVGALGRPAIESDAPARSRVFVVMDRTASMSAADMPGGQTRFEAGVARAREMVREALSGLDAPSVSLISLAREARVVTPPTRVRGEIDVALEMLTPTDQPGRLEPALRLIESMLERETAEGEEGTPALVILISDGGCAAGGALSLAGADLRFERVAPETSAGNLGVTALGVSRDLNDPALVRLFFEVQSTLPERVATTLDLEVGGRVALSRPVVLAGASEEARTGAVTAELPLPAGGLVRARLAREDALASDNAVQLRVSAPSRPSVLLVAPDGAADRFLRRVLEEMDLAQLRIVAPEDYDRFLSAGLSGFDLVVLDRAGRAPEGVPTLSFGVPTPGLRVQEQTSSTQRVVSWTRSDPVLRDVTLDTLLVGAHGALAPDPGVSDVRREALVTGTRGALVWRVERLGVERIAVAFGIEDSNWGLQLSLPLFIANAVETLTGRTPENDAAWFSTVEPARVRLGGTGGSVRLSGPVEREAPVPGSRPAGAPVELGVLERVGVYEARLGGERAEVCVNLLDARESRIEAPASIEVGGGRVTPAGVGDAPTPREIWHWFVLAASVLLVLEWSVYAWRMRV